jgi:hypothetical protein
MASLFEATSTPVPDPIATPETSVEQKTPEQTAKPLIVQTGQQITPTPDKKDVVVALSNILPRMTYYGPTELHTEIGNGCSKIAASTTQKLYGVYDPTSNQDAWYAKASVLKAGGKEVWNESMKNDYSKMQIGTYVSLDRPFDWYGLKSSKDKSLTLKDNENIEHRGVVVGFDNDGTPMIKHGSASGKTVVQRMDKLKLPDHDWSYKAKSAYTSASIMGKEIVDKRFYKKPEEADVISYTPTVNQTAVQKLNSRMPAGVKPLGEVKAPAAKENEIKFIQSLNQNLAKQTQILGLEKSEANLIAKVAFGIFHNESEAGYSKTPIGGKMLAKSLFSSLGMTKSSPSLSDVQFKFDDLSKNADGSTSKVGQNLLDLGVERDGLSNWNHHRDDYTDEVNAVAASAAATLARIKANPKKYKYNPKTQTILGDVPLGVALAAAYTKGAGVISSKEALMKADKKGNKAINYGNNAMSWGNKLNISPKKKSK